VAEIAAVDGLDALFVGPADLSKAVGCFLEYDSEAFQDAITTVIDESEIPVGTVVGRPDMIETFADLGYDFLVAGHDTAALIAGGLEAKLTADAALSADS